MGLRIIERHDIMCPIEERISEPILLKMRLWRLADRVPLETAVPPMFGKEVAGGFCSKTIKTPPFGGVLFMLNTTTSRGDSPFSQ